jgi:iron(III) transport system ATP-binding protein
MSILEPTPPAKSTPKAAALSIENISLAYGDHRVLNDISLEIRPGEFFALLGPSGCGKTTLLRLIAGFAQADRGRVRIDGQDISRLPPWRRDVGMVFQNYALWPHMSVARNVAFGLEERRLPRGEITRHVGEALALVGMSALAERKPSQLSGGQQQRVALARTVAIEPRILLLDEPLSNLDAKLRVQVRRELRELQQRLGLTTILVTHDQEEANTICDRVAVMNDGVIRQVGAPTEIYQDPRDPFVANFLGSANILRGRIVEAAGKRVFEAEGGARLSLPEGFTAGGGDQLFFRPQDAALVGPDEQSPAGSADISGMIAFREFLGSSVRYQIQAGSNTLATDVPFHGGDALYAIGETVTIAIPAQRLRWLNG